MRASTKAFARWRSDSPQEKASASCVPVEIGSDEEASYIIHVPMGRRFSHRIRGK